MLSSMYKCSSGGGNIQKKINRPLDAVVTTIKYDKITIDHTIYIKVFSDVAVSYIMFCTDNVLNTTTNYTAFP